MRRSPTLFLAALTLLWATTALACSTDLDIDGLAFACDDDEDCADGFRCLMEPEEYDEPVCLPDGEEPSDCDCDPDENQSYECVDGQCVYDDCDGGTANCGGDSATCETPIDTADNCGGCGLSCQFEVDEPNATADCDGNQCIAMCDDGWINADGTFETGCSCSISADPDDTPKCDAIYVDPDNGSDGSSDATNPDTPFATLSTAITRARQDRQDDQVSLIMLAQGTYASEQIIDFPLTIVGGLTPAADWRQVDDDHRSIITWDGLHTDGIPTTLVIDGADDFSGLQRTLKNLDLRPPESPHFDDRDDWSADDASLITLRVNDLSDTTLTIEDSLLHGGDAADGFPGQDGVAADFSSDQHGGSGVDSDSDVDAGDSVDGGHGGAPACPDGAAGGDGGATTTCDPIADADNQTGPHPGDDGEDSDDALGGEGGATAYDVNVCANTLNDFNGSFDDITEPGAAGEPGASGDPGQAGQLTQQDLEHHIGQWSPDEGWSPFLGDHGTDGGQGGGGGGGAAGNSTSNPNGATNDQTGGSGGGGGAGGCGGEGGQRALPGGASIVLFAIDADILFEGDTTLFAGQAGHGADGGDGACASRGGFGGEAGSAPLGAGGANSGGCGAMGGYGGIGAGGAASHGGPSIGIATADGASFNGPFTFDDSNATPTSAGVGGTTPSPEDCFGEDFDPADDADTDCPSSTFIPLDDLSSDLDGSDGQPGILSESASF